MFRRTSSSHCTVNTIKGNGFYVNEDLIHTDVNGGLGIEIDESLLTRMGFSFMMLMMRFNFLSPTRHHASSNEKDESAERIYCKFQSQSKREQVVRLDQFY
jgi:hypothetical protein